ncbi:hypothetical protein GWI33_009268 [Rhynchophorus ferrugineus]|uniref:Uncharacterized protein n=1 Tax=Rhynchophorus ferrugineus TaxID=354439 RepID=A0A834MAE9_RHYFE|nr:hypothetical protein GWI33_009268 [Rhynchophorus ferrugineus]
MQPTHCRKRKPVPIQNNETIPDTPPGEPTTAPNLSSSKLIETGTPCDHLDETWIRRTGEKLLGDGDRRQSKLRKRKRSGQYTSPSSQRVRH